MSVLFANSFYSMIYKSPSSTKRFDAEIVATTALLSAALVVGLATVGDYGITVDEFNADDYGPKALAWYTSGFTNRSHFETVEEFLWYYGPWFHMLTAFVQSFGFANPFTVRHAMTFSAGLLGLAALLPIGRLAVGQWAGLAAIALCLMTGNLYGSIFFTPIDVPFLVAMSWATLAIVVMAKRIVPSWPATMSAGLLTGFAIATRTGGIITHAYLIGAMFLCGLEVVVRQGRLAWDDLLRIGIRTVCVVAIAWIVTFALWPWLQVGNPFSQFKIAFVHFANLPIWGEFPHWGETIRNIDFPPTYVVGQLFARLPEAFLVFLAIGFLFGLVRTSWFLRTTFERFQRRGMVGLYALALCLARSRAVLIVWAAVILPIGFLIIQRSTLYDGIRHTLFVIPMLAVLASIGFVRLLPLLCRVPVSAAVVGGAYVGVTILTLVTLHPLEYVATNIFAGRTTGSYGRFDLDYWSVAATVALRRLERRLDYDTSMRFADRPPSIMICIAFRESMVAPMLGRPWRIEVDPKKADFLIETERWRCAKDTDAILIDEVKRFDRTFAWTHVRRSPMTD